MNVTNLNIYAIKKLIITKINFMIKNKKSIKKVLFEEKKDWYVVFFSIIFIFIMGIIISKSIIIAFFSSIWFFGLYLTIILFIKFDRNLDLKEDKRKNQSNNNETEIINMRYILIKEKNIFRIIEEWSNVRIGFLFGFIITLVGTGYILILELLLQVLKYGEVRNYLSLVLIVLIFILPFNIPWFIAYLYYRKREIVCIIDKTSKIILLENILPNYKILRKILFSNVKDFGYSIIDTMSCIYSLTFRDIYGVKITVFKGNEEENIHLYNEISNFLEFKFDNENKI